MRPKTHKMGDMKISRETKKLLDTVGAYCERHGLRFTDPRRLVLTIIAESKNPVGAYDVLAQFGKTVKNPKPPTIYRALEFLQENGFIHKIESLNAFVPCHADHAHHGSQFMICDDCGRVEEVHLCNLPDPLQKKLNKTKFKLAHWNVELHGHCADCDP